MTGFDVAPTAPLAIASRSSWSAQESFQKSIPSSQLRCILEKDIASSFVDTSSDAGGVADVVPSHASIVSRVRLRRILLGLDDQPACVPEACEQPEDRPEIEPPVAGDGEDAGAHGGLE